MAGYRNTIYPRCPKSSRRISCLSEANSNVDKATTFFQEINTALDSAQPTLLFQFDAVSFRDWSLITGIGGGGAIKRGGGGSHAERGAKKSFEVVLTWELEVLAIVMGGLKSFTLSSVFGPAIFPFCNPLLPVINDRSLGHHTFNLPVLC